MKLFLRRAVVSSFSSLQKPFSRTFIETIGLLLAFAEDSPPNEERAHAEEEELTSTPRGIEDETFVADETMPISTSLALLAAIRASRSCS